MEQIPPERTHHEGFPVDEALASAIIARGEKDGEIHSYSPSRLLASEERKGVRAREKENRTIERIEVTRRKEVRCNYFTIRITSAHVRGPQLTYP